MATSLIDMLDQWEVKMIAEFLSPFNALLLRASCIKGATSNIVIGAVPMSDDEYGDRDPEWLLRCAAEGGHRELCILAREWGAIDFDSMLNYSARGGHRNICVLAREWEVTDFNRMLGSAAGCADPVRARDLCILARKWLDAEDIMPDFSCMLHNAAVEGNRDLCELAYKWAREWWLKLSPAIRASASPMDFNDMLSCAAECADPVRGRDLCILAREWLDTEHISPNFNDMINHAARGGQRDLCILAREWWREAMSKTTGAKPPPMNFDIMLSYAAKRGDRELCILAREWGATNFKWMFSSAAGCTDPIRARDIRDLAREWDQLDVRASFSH